MESQDDETAILKVAESVSDGVPVDWNSPAALQKAAGSDLAPLQLLEKVATAYRSTAPPRQRGSDRIAPESADPRNTRSPQPATSLAPHEQRTRPWRGGLLRWVLAGSALLAGLLLLVLWKIS